MSINFNDGSLHEDISKSKLGYLLLRCIRYYIELDIYALFEVHTEETIAAGRATLDTFSELMEEYITKSQPETSKNWNFPKKHMITHIFDDILAKGATCNYNAKPNEKMHHDGALQKIYLQRTNFKDVAPQATDPETNEPDIEPVAGSDPVAHVRLGSKQGKHSFSDIMHTHRTNSTFTELLDKA
ncbi:hypothetical protein DFJ58DRAFT_712346 [Suillus subalutaceus]|uniref:uncharacterized protein n=1 Tax=Suillus subalutaceus TaxID=48586 RepID=UPI001B85C6A1|nr:uncharacterized protein DFJ58DRAFT_712346 [Suillus subalutaceus]KAG1877636.1 hypothetical protein DFJ58DRAFT_712346 [Suillus subalutaceus]